MNINLISSCVFRDAFGIQNQDLYESKMQNREININRYVNAFSPLNYDFSKIDNILKESDSELLKNIQNKFIPYKNKCKNVSNFWMRCSSLDITHNIFNYILSSESDYLGIDNGFGRLNYLQLEDNRIIVDNYRHFIDFLIKEGVIPKIKKAISFDQFSEKYIEEKIIGFIKFILTKYDYDKIILLEVIPALYYVMDNQIFNFNPKTYLSLSSRLSLCFKLLKKHLPFCHVIPTPSLVIGNFYHKWGLYNLHYTDEFYKYYIDCFNIIQQKNSIDKERALIQERLNIFNTYINNSYNLLIQKRYFELLQLPFLSVNKSWQVLNTYHKTIIYLDLETHCLVNLPQFSIQKSQTNSESNIHPIKALVLGDYIILLSNIDNENKYILSIDDKGHVSFSNLPKYFYISQNSNSFYICVSKGFLSARNDGSIKIVSRRDLWEQFYI